VVKETKNSLLDWPGATIGASHHPSADITISLAEELGGKNQAILLGRREKLNVLFGALINGMADSVCEKLSKYAKFCQNRKN